MISEEESEQLVAELFWSDFVCTALTYHALHLLCLRTNIVGEDEGSVLCRAHRHSSTG